MKLFSKKSKFSQKNKFLLGIILIILFILVLSFFQNQVKSFFYSISSPVQKILWRVGDRTSDFCQGFIKINQTKNKADKLNLENQRLLAEIAILSELKKENKVLREGLEINLNKDFELSLVEIIGKDVHQDSILINKGYKDNISEKIGRAHV